MGLEVVVVGAGIAGLSASIALQKTGHTVLVFERSGFKNEVGAAITITPNGARVLDRWGFDFDAAGAVNGERVQLVDGRGLATVYEDSFAGVKGKFGYGIQHYHRVDLHRELRKLAESLGVRIKLGATVEAVDLHGTVTVQGGNSVSADLIVIADGVYSQHIHSVTGRSEPLVKLGRSAIRALVPMSVVESDPDLAPYFSPTPPGWFVPCTMPPEATQMVTYPCRDNKILNIGLIHNTLPEYEDREDWHSPIKLEGALEVIKDFHPACHKLLGQAEDITIYTLSRREPPSKLTNGRLVAIGDAAHVMPPTHAQGAALAIEEACALEVLLGGAKSSEVVQRLDAYNELMTPRASVVQLLSEAMPGSNDERRKQAEKVWRESGHGELYPDAAIYYSEPIRDFFYSYDVKAEAEKIV